MAKRRYFIFLGVFTIGVLIWQLPELLKMIPSRYIAAYLPQSMQALAERDHVDILPAPPKSVDAASLVDIGEKATLEPTEERGSGSPPSVGTQSPFGSGGLETSSHPSEVEGNAIKEEPTLTPEPPTATPEATLIPIPRAVRLEGFRHEFQGWNNCGPATLSMALSYFDIVTNQVETASILKPNPEDRNVSPYEMAAYVNQETDLEAINRSNGSLESLKRFVALGIPVIIELGLDPPGEYRWMGWYGHYLLVIAFDDELEQLWVYDSWFGTSDVPAENAHPQGRTLSYDDLETYWRQFGRSYIVIFGPSDREAVEEIIGDDLDDEEMWGRALDQAREELAESPENAFLWFNLGTSYNELGQYEKAAAAFDQARSLGLPWRMLWYQFGPYEAYYQIGRYEDVVLLADTTLEDRPYFEESYYYKGLALEAMGQSEQARENLEKAVKFNPNFEPASAQLALLGG